MEPGIIGTRLASAAVGPLVRKLFVTEGPGAGLVTKPIRISGYVSFRGEKRSLTESDLRTLAAKLVRQALRHGERPVTADEQQAVTDALAATLHALGDLTMSDVDAVRLGATAFARALRGAAGRPERELTADGTYFYERLLEAACLHILHFFTQRSTFVAHALVEQTRGMAELTAKVDELIRRDPLPGAQDAAFEAEYLPWVARKHAKLTIYGIDLSSTPRRWPLDAAYLSLEVTSPLGSFARGPFGRAMVTVLDLWGSGAEGEAADRDRDVRIAAALAQQSGGRLRADGGQDDVPFDPATLTRDVRRLLDQPVDQVLGDNRRILLRGEAGSAETTLGRWIAEAFAPQPADQALAASHRVLLRGEAGSGKTTLVQWLAMSAGRQDLPPEMAYLEDRIPFVLPLRTLTRHGERLPGPREFLTAAGCPLGGGQPDGWAHRVLSAGRGLVLVDGIDEVPDAERERTRTWLGDLMDLYDGDNRWLVTSRPSAVGMDWLAEEGFTELTLSAMSPAEVATFIKRWHAAARQGTDEDKELKAYEAQLLASVRLKPELGRLATNPLMCGLICALHRDRRGYLPHGRKDLYEAALSMLISRRDRERDMRVPDLREEPQLDLLQRLAYWLIKNGRTEMDRSRAEEIIARALPAVPEAAALGGAPAVFDHFLQRSGLLREPGPGTVHFVHRTFQDFLGARAAVEEGDFGLLAGHAGDDQWEDVIRMAVALARPAERAAIFRDLLALGDGSADRRTQVRVYLLAAACLEHATTLAPEMRAEVEARTATLIPPSDEDEARALAEVGPLLLDLLPGPEGIDDWDARNVVIAASHVASEAAVPFLARFAGHPFPLVRSQLVWSWGRFDCADYADAVIARLEPAHLDYTLRSDDQLEQLERLGLRPERLDIRRDVSGEALARFLGRYRPVDLRLQGASVSDLAFLTSGSAPTSLTLSGCPGLKDLSALGGMPITHLDVATPRPDFDLSAVSGLRDLETLGVDGPAGMSWSVRDLPAGAPLSRLFVFGGVTFAGALEGLGAFSRLRQLVLAPASSPASAADWQEVRSLPLVSLRVSLSSLAALPAEATLPDIKSLELSGGGEEALRSAIPRIPTAFPLLESCRFTGDFTGDGEIDIAPMAQLPALREVAIEVNGARIRGADLIADVRLVVRAQR
ncbi:NACHT domain-containing protein [Streptomyces sp. 3211.6]|uniref:NACHT domain-containing protein n=1 Tax=Streptomyces sp. 3211.6 TaxID=1938845 RepID=UPI000EAE4AE7|nr:NACHT domain-containing protein [Streptomyces sp. 3211.6]RKT07407.1 NACHT domain-containing protein [Streptomyces sp. 3211.6]